MIKKILWGFGPLALIALLGVTTSGFPSQPFFSAYTVAGGTSSKAPALVNNANLGGPEYTLCGTGSAVGLKCWQLRVGSAGAFALSTADDTGVTQSTPFSISKDSSGNPLAMQVTANTSTWFSTAGQNVSGSFQSPTGKFSQLFVLSNTTASEAGICVSDTAALCSASSAANDTSIFGSGAIRVQSQSGADYAQLTSTGVNIPTGSTYKINSVNAIPQTAVGSWLQGVSTCTGQGTPRGMTCVTNAAGTQSTITFSPAFATTPTCNLNGSQSTAVQQNTISTPSTSGVVIVTTSPMTFYLQCSV